MKILFSVAAAIALATAAAAQGLVELPNRVAAGDVTQTSAVLWARVGETGTVTFWFVPLGSPSGVWRSQAATVVDGTLPAKVFVQGLLPGRLYVFLAQTPSGDFDAGTFRTPYPVGAHHGLRFGVSGDSRGELAPYPSVGNARGRNLDFFVNMGDTIYADVPSPALGLGQARTISDFRTKHDEVLSEHLELNALSDLRATTASFAVIDDHEVTNDFAGGAPASSDPRFAGENGAFINETELFGNGVQTFIDYQPIRDLLYGATGDSRTAGKRDLYRVRLFGSDAALFLLDARSFRDRPLDNVSNPFDSVEVARFLGESFDPSRTMLGRVQLDRLEAHLPAVDQLGVTWKFIAVPEPIQNLGILYASDRFEGYAAERTELLAFIHDRNIKNVVFLSADFHGTFVNNLSYRTSPSGPNIDVDSFEIVNGPIAYDAPFGPTIVDLALQIGLINQNLKNLYQALPPSIQDRLVELVLDLDLGIYGYDAIGLGGSTIQATLQNGGYTATHYYGWTELAIDAATQTLTVTVFGIDSYTENDLDDDPDGVLARVPSVVSRFVVVPAAK
jgi:alkaline phosphatase D